jgi:hypothetical protein
LQENGWNWRSSVTYNSLTKTNIAVFSHLYNLWGMVKGTLMDVEEDKGMGVEKGQKKR